MLYIIKTYHHISYIAISCTYKRCVKNTFMMMLFTYDLAKLSESGRTKLPKSVLQRQGSHAPQKGGAAKIVQYCVIHDMYS